MDVLVGDGLRDAVNELIRSSNSFLFLMTPYFDPTLDQMRWLAEARIRTVRVTVLVREGDADERTAAASAQCEKMGVRIVQVPRLHAKAYASESMLILTSMNLTAGSLDSWDMGIRIVRNAEPDMARKVTDSLKDLDAFVRRVRAPQDDIERRTRIIAMLMDDRYEEVRQFALAGDVFAQQSHRFCLVCHQTNRGEGALCPSCTARSVAAGRELPGQYCMTCGQPARTSEERPLCRPCYERDVLLSQPKPAGARSAVASPQGLAASAPRQGQPWTADEEADLTRRWQRQETVEEIATALGRTPVGIAARLEKLRVVSDRELAFARSRAH